MTIGNKLPLAHMSSRRYVYSTPEIQVEYSANMKQADCECIWDTEDSPDYLPEDLDSTRSCVRKVRALASEM